MCRLFYYYLSALVIVLFSLNIRAQTADTTLQQQGPQFEVQEQIEQDSVQHNTNQDSLKQEESSDTTGVFRKFIGSFGFFSYGWHLLKQDQLNQLLNSYAYPMFSDYAVTFGGGGLRIYNCFLLGGEGYMIFAQEKNTTAYDASLSSGYGFLNFGYRAIASSTILAYPLIGFGGGSSTLRIAEKVNGVNFNQLLVNPNRSLEVSTGSILINLSLNLNYFTRPITESGFHFGLSLGYIYSLPSDGWYIFNNNVVGGPVFDLSGPYLRLKFGGGSFRSS